MEKEYRTFGIRRKDCNQEQIGEQARTDVYSTTHSDSRHQRVCELIYDIDIFMSPKQSQCILVGVRRSRPISSSRNVIIFKKCMRMALLARIVAMLYIHRQAQRSLKDIGHPCCLDPFGQKKKYSRCQREKDGVREEEGRK
jgi:hypothetical protein